MINYFFPNDYFAIVYFLDRISLLDMKSIVCWKKTPLFEFEIAINDCLLKKPFKGSQYIRPKQRDVYIDLCAQTHIFFVIFFIVIAIKTNH